MYKLWVNVGENGTIIATYGGHERYIVNPSEIYDYYFEVSDDVFKDVGNYQVSNGELIRKEA
ncbi:hypothetical protein DOE78_18795 [Bacillus sp. Y1]|nr:hypothetical protein [Bacillus sp. Y1]AYA77332.1 hypothetical protein DOE78_18795 [Bacillus sp. Y1]